MPDTNNPSSNVRHFQSPQSMTEFKQFHLRPNSLSQKERRGEVERCGADGGGGGESDLS